MRHPCCTCNEADSIIPGGINASIGKSGFAFGSPAEAGAAAWCGPRDYPALSEHHNLTLNKKLLPVGLLLGDDRHIRREDELALAYKLKADCGSRP